MKSKEKTNKTIDVAVLGASGYAGGELLRLLHNHRFARVALASSEKNEGKRVTDVFPHLTAYEALRYESMDAGRAADRADLVFLALPHKASQDAVYAVLRAGKRAVDLSADFRLRDPRVYEAWYATPHGRKALLKKAVYGLPELYRDRIRKATLVANPGCYPTGAILALMPAFRKRLIDPASVVLDSKSGVSGAGRSPSVPILYAEVSDGMKAYGIAVHRHTPEIEQALSGLARAPVVVDFTPHLVPMGRGILTTAYAVLKNGVRPDDVRKAYVHAYRDEPFVRVLPEGESPVTKHVRGSNYCHLGITINARTGRLIVVSAIDNLVKGAAGQAIHNMNLMMGYSEDEGLQGMGVFP